MELESIALVDSLMRESCSGVPVERVTHVTLSTCHVIDDILAVVILIRVPFSLRAQPLTRSIGGHHRVNGCDNNVEE